MKQLLLLLTTIVFVSCSIFQTTDQQEQTASEEDSTVEEVYVFDDVSENESKTEEIDQLKKEIDNKLQEKEQREVDIFDEPIDKNEAHQLGGSKYFLQLGAFTTLKRAEQFVKEINNNVPFLLSIIYNPDNSFYTVRSTVYSTRSEVEEVKSKLWSNNLFIDAFIVTE